MSGRECLIHAQQLKDKLRMQVFGHAVDREDLRLFDCCNSPLVVLCCKRFCCADVSTHDTSWWKVGMMASKIIVRNMFPDKKVFNGKAAQC